MPFEQLLGKEPAFRLRTFELLMICRDLCLLGRLTILDARIVKKEVLQAVRGCRPYFGINFEHILQKILEQHVLLTPLFVNQVVQSQHLLDVLS